MIGTKMDDPRSRHIPSLKKVLDDTATLELVTRAFPVAKPLLKLLGVNVDQMGTALSEVPDLARRARELVALPDQFNHYFAARGWIAFDSMNVELAQATVAKAAAGDIEGAEQDLVAYYTPARIDEHLRFFMNSVKAFRPRMELARKALTDYAEGRYYACVPVTLALLDGMVNELGPRASFAEGVSLKAWDSIAAHSSGLQELSKILGAGRYQTNLDAITVPYRHGILHGLDLNYDSQLVAAKAWAALFAARDWALKVEHGTVAAPPPEPKASWHGLFQQILNNADDKARLERWAPRHLTPGVDIGRSGDPDAYQQGTPERRLAEFLSAWRARNYGEMAQCLPRNPYEENWSINNVAGQLRAYYQGRLLQGFELQAIDDQAAAVSIHAHG